MDSSSLSNSIQALAPAFVAGFAVQQAVEVVSSIAAFIPGFDAAVKVKKLTLLAVSLAFSWFVVCHFQLDIIQAVTPRLKDGAPLPSFSCWNAIVTIIFISAGTEGFNSLLKWLNYKKEETKTRAADKKQQLNNTAPKALDQMSS
jgi:hypothetical protein